MIFCSGTAPAIKSPLLSYFANSNYLIEQFQFSDGVTWNQADVKARVITMGTSGNDGITGYDDGENRIYGLDGNDSLTGGALSDSIYDHWCRRRIKSKYSAMTGQSLFYMGETNLKHKILAIVEEEGAERASYALKLLQSEGALTIASTGKDASTGRMVTQEYRVEGPVMIFLTTTAIKIDEELLNRCIVLSVDENREQTRAIHQFQRRRQTLDGLLADQDRKETLTLHRNAQRLLRPLLVANPYAESLDLPGR